jgi:hypothetical protein
MAEYNVIAVQRTQQSSGAPVLNELGPLEASVEWADNLNEAPEGKFTVDVDSLQDDIKTSLRDLVAQPLEVWVYRDGVRVFKGPLIGGEIKGGLLAATARGAEFYTAYMHVETLKTFAAVDQYTIATDVIDDWQIQTYGHYGIDTSAIGTSGTTRSLEIPGLEEPRPVYEVLQELTGGDNGFDWWVSPTDDELKLAALRGSDKSATVFLELGVVDPGIRFTVAPGVIGSEAFGSAVGGDTVGTVTKSNTGLRASWGRSGLAVTVDGDPDASTLADATQGHLDERAETFFIPGPEMIPVAGASVGDFNVGDFVTYTFDAGLGQQTGVYRIRKRRVVVGNDGQERMAVDFV